jgi:2-haloacid dehalogenase/putative hydrolase of the HAD superfamily
VKLSDFKALTFDVYGTLIDWEGGMITGLKPLTDRANQPLTRDDILEAHAFYKSTAQRFSPAKKYFELLPVVYRRLAEEWDVEVTWEECVACGMSARHWHAFEDTIEALT